jgi:uncharacterized protein DUF4124
MNHRGCRRALVALIAIVWPCLAHGTVYRWKGEGGVVMFSNDADDVPEDQRTSADKFTAKPAPPRAASDTAGGDDPAGGDVDTYDRGFARGLAAAERQLDLAERLARTSVAPLPPPAPIIIQQAAPPPPPAQPYVSYGAPGYYYSPYLPQYYGFANPFLPYPLTTFGFGSTFVTRSRVFPGRGHFGSFGPHRRGGFGHDGFRHHDFGHHDFGHHGFGTMP